MKFVKGMALLIAALVLQATLLQLSFLRGNHPDLVLFTLVVLSLKYGPIYGVFFGFLIGLFQDIYVVETLGLNAFAKSIVGYCLGLFDESRFTFSSTTKLLLLFISFIFHDLISGIVMGWPVKGIFLSLVFKSLPAAVITLIMGSVFFYFIRPKIKPGRV